MNNSSRNRGLTYRQLNIFNRTRQLWIEHVLWTRFFIISTVFGLPDQSFVTQRLLRNPVDFERLLQQFFGENKARRFKDLLTTHLTIAAQLVSAAKAGNSAEADMQRRLWYENANDIARFLASINPFWRESQWRDLLFEHLRMTEDEAVYILNGQYEKSIKEYDEIQAQAMDMADVMAYGIINQFRIR